MREAQEAFVLTWGCCVILFHLLQVKMMTSFILIIMIFVALSSLLSLHAHLSFYIYFSLEANTEGARDSHRATSYILTRDF